MAYITSSDESDCEYKIYYKSGLLNSVNGPLDVYNLILNITLCKSTRNWQEDIWQISTAFLPFARKWSGEIVKLFLQNRSWEPTFHTL